MENQIPLQNIPQQTPLPPVMPPSRSYWKMIGIGMSVVSVFIAIAVVGYLLVLNKNASKAPAQSTITTTPTPTTDPTVNWKTYANTKYGYTLKYPPNFIIWESFDQNGNIDTTTISNYDQKALGSGTKDPDDTNVFLMFIINPWRGITSLEKARSDYKVSSLRQINNYNVGGMPGFKVSENGSFNNYGVEVVTVNNNKEYNFQLKSSKSMYASYFDQILSTFKFTNQGTACPQIAKLCPDGKTYTSPTGPNCEFAKCPGQ